MSTGTAVLAASLTGFFGALAVTGIGVRFTRNLCVLACSGILSGTALGALAYVLCGWFTRGFVLFEVSVPAFAALILLLVMTAQNWFVFYEDRQDVLHSSRPTLILLAAAAAAVLTRIVAGKHSVLFPVIWASAASWAILSCIDPVQRSIERTRSVLMGTMIGIGKIVIPMTGVVLFLRPRGSAVTHPHAAAPGAAAPDTIAGNWFVTNLIGLFWDLGQITLLILINGARIPPAPVAFDPLALPGQQKNAHSLAGESSRVKRNSVVLIFVLAIHVLCGVVIAKA